MNRRNLMISIITPSLNQDEFLEKNIKSVISQKYSPTEHIVIDGGSVDSSIDILKGYKHITWISEKDDGQSQAINKGFKMAKGDIIGWLNSDDVYMPDTFYKVNDIFLNNESLDFIFSNCILIDAKDRITGFFSGKDPKQFNVLNNTNFIPQPTVFFRKRIFDITGYLDEGYNMSMDFDFWRRISKSHQMAYIDDNFACFREHNQAKTYRYVKKFKIESKRSFFKNGGSIFSPYYFETFIKPFLISLFIYNPITKKIFFVKK